MPFWVDPDPLRESVKDKASKYRELVHSTELPLVVCVIADFMTARGLDEVQEAVLGKEQCRLECSQGEFQQEYYRGNDGLFAKYPTLSAVTLGAWNGDTLAHTVLLNPSAAYPLVEGMLGSSSTSDNAE